MDIAIVIVSATVLVVAGINIIVIVVISYITTATTSIMTILKGCSLLFHVPLFLFKV